MKNHTFVPSRIVGIAGIAVCLACVATSVPATAKGLQSAVPPVPAKPRLVEAYGQLSLSFERNDGQTDTQVKFLARGRGYTLFLTPTEAVIVLRSGQARGNGPEARGSQASLSPQSSAVSPSDSPSPLASDLGPAAQSVVRMRLDGSTPSPLASGLEPLPGIVNYFIGNDPTKWRTNIPTYKKVQ